MNNSTKGKAGISLAMMIFGSIGLFVRAVDAQSSQIALSRAAIGSVFLILVSWVIKIRTKSRTNLVSDSQAKFGQITDKKYNIQKAKNLRLLLISGAAIGFNWIFLFEAYKNTSIAVATVSYYFAPVFVILLSPIVLGEKISRLRILTMFTAFAGLVLTIVGELSGQSFGIDEIFSGRGITGVLFGLSAALLYASVILITKRIHDIPGLEMTQLQLTSAFVVLLPYVAFTSGFASLVSLSPQELVILATLGIIHTGFAYFLYFSSARQVPAQSIALLSYIDPVFAIFFAAVFLKEIPGPLQIAGAVLILGSAFFSETVIPSYINVRKLKNPSADDTV
jgi:drug/metabolite transporter (DMT)-like permease